MGTIDLNRNAQAAVAKVHAFPLPGKCVVRACGTLFALSLDKLQVAHVPLHDRDKKRFRQSACGRLVKVRPGRRLGDLLVEAGYLALGCHGDAKFLLLLWLEPPMLPTPEMYGTARQFIHALQALRALEIQLGIVVVIEDRRMTIAAGMKTALNQKSLAEGCGIVAVYTYVNRSFGEGSGEIAQAEYERERRHGNDHSDNPVFSGCQFDRH